MGRRIRLRPWPEAGGGVLVVVAVVDVDAYDDVVTVTAVGAVLSS